jgi:N-acetylglucosaminyl-diphospho-decaprenol L-rhamnosyltransferase
LDAVTVTANSGAELEQLIACEPLMRSFDRVIVVDNLSDDGSPEMARRAGAVVISRSDPAGYGTCVNMGAREARGPFFCVLNPDITWDAPDVVERLCRHFERPEVGVVAPALILPDGHLQDSAREIPTPWDLVVRRHSEPERGAIREAGEVPWVVGACFLVRRSAWDQVGGFDPGFFLYFEDVDLCWRLRQAGWRTHLDPSVTVRHDFQAGSRAPIWSRRTRQHLASALRFYRRNPRFILTRSLPPSPAHIPVSAQRP